MRKVYHGKIYDTETAKMVAAYYSDAPVGDSSYWEERLYRKKNGEYFLHGFGGPCSKYKEGQIFGEISGGEKIEPVSITTAMQWAEKMLPGEEYESIFGEIRETGDKVAITVSVSSVAAEMLSRASSATGKTKSKIVESLILTMDKAGGKK